MTPSTNTRVCGDGCAWRNTSQTRQTSSSDRKFPIFICISARDGDSAASLDALMYCSASRCGLQPQGLHLLLAFVTQPVCHFMPHHPLHFTPQISPRTPQNGPAKNKDQFGSIRHLGERPFRPECAAVQPQQLSSPPPFPSLRYVLQYVRRRLVHHLNAGEIWQVSDLLWQGTICPLHNLLKAFGTCGVGHEPTLPPGQAARRTTPQLRSEHPA